MPDTANLPTWEWTHCSNDAEGVTATGSTEIADATELLGVRFLISMNGRTVEMVCTDIEGVVWNEGVQWSAIDAERYDDRAIRYLRDYGERAGRG